MGEEYENQQIITKLIYWLLIRFTAMVQSPKVDKS